MDVSESRGPQVRQVFLLHGVTLSPQGVEGRLHINRVPHHHRIRQQIQTARLVGLTFFVFLTYHPFAGKEEKLPHIVELLALVELGMNALA
jgi:hypothetical protein